MSDTDGTTRHSSKRWYVLLAVCVACSLILILTPKRDRPSGWKTRIPGTEKNCCSTAELIAREDGTILAALGSGAASQLAEFDSTGELVATVPLTTFPSAMTGRPDGSVVVAGPKGGAVEIASYDPQLNVQWTRRSTGRPLRSSIAAISNTHPDGFAVTGNFGGSITFADGEKAEDMLQYSEKGVHPDSWRCLFTASFSEEGSLRWQKSWPVSSRGFGIAGMLEGVAVVGGRFDDESMELPLKTGNKIMLSNYPSFDLKSICICAYDQEGEILWVRQLGGAHDVQLAAAPDGSRFYVIALFDERLLLFDLNGRCSIQRTVDGGFGVSPENAAVLAFDAAGKFLWDAAWPLKRFQFLPDLSLDSPPDPFPVDCTAANERILVSYPLQKWRPFTKKPNPVFHISEIDSTGRMRRRGKFIGPPKAPCLAPPQIAALDDASFVYLTCSPEGAQLGTIE